MHVDNIFGINIEVEEDNETCHFHEGLEKEENPLLLK